MKLAKTSKTQVSEVKDVPGLLSCQVDYEIKTASGTLHYGGPKIAPQMWHQVMSFFRWTQQEMRSESQVRIYVNSQLGRWAAWAFPQAARTGMSARELAIPETPEQARERFVSWHSEPSDDWIYFGTVHHHCSASAFQSGTDEQNERNQDGLHITVGKIDAERHDLHARFYLGGNRFEPDLSLFWPIDPGLAEKVPPGMLHELASHQMCEKISLDFPDAWREHIIEAQPDPRLSPPSRRWDLSDPELRMPSPFRLDAAWEEISQQCAATSVSEEQWMQILHALSENNVSQIIIEACLRHGVEPGEILAEAERCALGF